MTHLTDAAIESANIPPSYFEPMLNEGNLGALQILPSHIEDYQQIPRSEVKRLRGDMAIQVALGYASQLFPDSHIQLLSDEGSSAVVLEDTNGRAFKVFRSSDLYSYVEDEAASMILLSEEKLSPEVFALVDADITKRRERVDRYIDGTTGTRIRQFGEIRIPRIEGHGEYPVIVMERIDASPISSIPTVEKASEEFMRVVEIGRRLGLVFGDVEFVFDNNSKRVRILDTGGVVKYRPTMKQVHYPDGPKDRYPDLSDDEFRDARLVADLMRHFLEERFNIPSEEVNYIAAILRQSGDDGLIDVFAQLWSSVTTKSSLTDGSEK